MTDLAGNGDAGGRGAIKAEQFRAYLKAQAWGYVNAATPEEEPFSFRWLCLHLDYDADTIIRLLKEKNASV